MNVLELQDNLKNFSEDQLVNEMQQPSGNVPQYLVLSEINRRKRIRDDYQQQQQAEQSKMTVAQEKLAGAGVPAEGLAGLAASMAPKTDITENTGATPDQTMPLPEAPAPMAELPRNGGIAAMAGGGYVQRYQLGGPLAGGNVVVHNGMQFQVNPDGIIIGPDGQPVTDPAMVADILGEVQPASEERSWGQRNIGDPLRRLLQPVGDAARDIGQPIGEAARDIGQPIGNAMREVGEPIGSAIREGLAPSVFDATTPPSIGGQPFGGSASQTATALSELNISQDDFAALDSEDRQAILDDPTRPMRERTAEMYPPGEAPFGTGINQPGFFLETFMPNKAADIRARRYEQQQRLEEERAEAAKDKPTSSVPDSGDDLNPSMDKATAIRLMTSDDAYAYTPPSPDPDPTKTTKITGGTGGSAGGGAGSIESQIIEMLKEREKRAESEKWLSLAQAGLALMASDQPTLGGAIGEAGQVGLTRLGEARDDYEGAKMALLKTQQAMQAARAGSGRSRDYNNPSTIGAALARFEKMREGMLGRGTRVITDPVTGEQKTETVYRTYADLSPDQRKLYDYYSGNIANLVRQYSGFFPADMTG